MIKPPSNVKKQTGFLLPAAIFLLVVLAGLGAYAVNMNAIQQNASTQDIQGARAYHAARAGIEWAVYEILQTSPLHALPACPSPTTLNLEGFNVTVNCSTSGSYTEQGGDNTIHTYEINSTASTGTLNTLNYIERRIDLSFSKCSDGISLCQ